MVFYRKYRPQKISDLDLSDARERLTSILSSKEIPHAFLFTGSRGLGKTSSARILAKAINCISKKGIEPCNNCDICKSITEGSHIDIIEIDAASNRGVDEMRSLREKVKFSPSELSKKVYIIDEVHMLTNEAFNALLKTLEEPPSHVVFILATTEAHKIPQTILSRTFSVKFEKPTDEEVANSLKRIVKGEGLIVEGEVYDKISELSEGSFRDAAKILEELSLHAEDKKIDSELLEKVYKTGSSTNQSEKLLDAIYKKEMNASLKLIDQISQEGIDFRIIIEKMVAKLRHDLIAGKSNIKIYELKKILELLNEAYAGVKMAVVPQLPLELAVMEWCVQENDNKDENKFNKEVKEAAQKKNNDKVQDANDVIHSDANFLKDLITNVHSLDKKVAAFLRSCNEASVTGAELTLKTPYSLHAEQLSKKEFSDIIIKSARDLNPQIEGLNVIVS